MLDKYVTKKPVAVADIKSKVIGDEDAKQLAEMYNEDIRKKAVYETNDFDPEDQKQIKNRETEAI